MWFHPDFHIVLKDTIEWNKEGREVETKKEGLQDSHLYTN